MAHDVKLADIGWCWDGQAFNGGTEPSIFGVGEGTRWFGLRKCCFLFHPNTALAMEKLAGFDAVVCEIAKWKTKRDNDWVRFVHDTRLDTKVEEARKVNQLAGQFGNLTGAIDDDLGHCVTAEGFSADEYAPVHAALKRDRPDLRLWSVVYERELDFDCWPKLTPYIDVVHLCIGKAGELANLDAHIEHCARVFPGKPINLCYRFRDFQQRCGVPLADLERDWRLLLRAIRDGRVDAFSILGGFMIDLHPEQARFIRDFIAAH